MAFFKGPLLLAAALSPLATNANPVIAARDATMSFPAGPDTHWRSSNYPVYQAPIVSLDNGVFFDFQTDGNIVAYQGNSVVWTAGSKGTCPDGRCQLQFQDDGNLVAVDYGVNPPQPFWNSATEKYNCHLHGGTNLVFRDSAPWLQIFAGNQLLWQTAGNLGGQSFCDTAQPPGACLGCPPDPCFEGDDCYPGDYP